MAQLFIDTSTEELLLGLHVEGNFFLETCTPHHNKLSEILLPSIQTLLLKKNLTIKDLLEVGVGNGPGSYTGTRVGVCVAKTLHFAIKVPLFSFCSLLTCIPNTVHGHFTYVLSGKRDTFFVLEGTHSENQLTYSSFQFSSKKAFEEKFPSLNPMMNQDLPKSLSLIKNLTSNAKLPLVDIHYL